MKVFAKKGFAIISLLVFSGWCVAQATEDLVLGPDADGNGVRDDVDAYVAALPDNESQRQAMLQLSMALNKQMSTNLEDDKAVVAALWDWSAAMTCAYFNYEHGSAQGKIDEAIKVTINTPERIEARAKFKQASLSHSIELLDENGCIHRQK
ncbi:hypothetical protein D3C87_466200 [compost metagenome]